MSTYLHLTRAQAGNQKVLVNMAQVLYITPVSFGSQLYFGHIEERVQVTETPDEISVLLGENHA